MRFVQASKKEESFSEQLRSLTAKCKEVRSDCCQEINKMDSFNPCHLDMINDDTETNPNID